MGRAGEGADAVCGHDGTFRSGNGKLWSHLPCGGKGDKYDAAVTARLKA